MKRIFFTAISFLLLSSMATSISHASNSLRSSHYYKCAATKGNWMVDLTVNVGGAQNKILIQRNVADFDPSYTDKTKSKVRFVYEESDEGTSESIMEIGLLNGVPKGGMMIVIRGEDFVRSNFLCTLVR